MAPFEPFWKGTGRVLPAVGVPVVGATVSGSWVAPLDSGVATTGTSLIWVPVAPKSGGF